MLYTTSIKRFILKGPWDSEAFLVNEKAFHVSSGNARDQVHIKCNMFVDKRNEQRIGFVSRLPLYGRSTE